MDTYNIAALVTCHNRKTKTLSSLHSAFQSLDAYNQGVADKIQMSIFLTDDGCTDGTSAAVREAFPDKDITIQQGNGHLYWAGGMRLAWEAALKKSRAWHFYLLMNDDTFFCKDAFAEFMLTHKYAMSKYGKGGVYTGVISGPGGQGINYGGKTYRHGILGRSESIEPSGTPQECQLTNANMLMVSREVVEKIGILCTAYKHKCADWAYGIDASHAGFPVLVTGRVCGYCENDHSRDIEKTQLMSMTLKERRKYMSSPVHSMEDTLTFMKTYQKIKVPFVKIAKRLKTYSPKLYYRMINR